MGKKKKGKNRFASTFRHGVWCLKVGTKRFNDVKRTFGVNPISQRKVRSYCFIERFFLFDKILFAIADIDPVNWFCFDATACEVVIYA